jgi:FkbM family methyltransferase
VGANIADSSIYFVLHGAKRVIGIEPLLKNYGLAERNIKLNNFANRITLILAGCSARSGSADVMISGAEGIGQQISRGLNNRMAVPLLTLEEILQQNNISREETALKMDCEGCEYDVILSSPDDVLKSFSNILIEYHYGYKEIKEKLEKSNFDISLINISGKQGGPTAVPNPLRLGRWYYMGYIHAKQK